MIRFRILTAALVVLGLLTVPAVAQAQALSIAVGSYSIPDLDGSTVASVTVDPAGTNAAALGATIGYDASIVTVTDCTVGPELGSCNFETPGEVVIQMVTADGWTEPFTAVEIALSAVGIEATSALTVTVDEAYDVDLGELSGTGVDGAVAVSSRAPMASAATSCADGDGVVDFTLENPMDDPRTFVLNVNDAEVAPVTVPAGESAAAKVTGVVDGMATVAVSVDGEVILQTSEAIECDPEVGPSFECTDGGADIAVVIVNRTGGFATYGVKIGTSPRSQRSISNSLSTTITSSVSVDGDVQIVVDRGGDVIYDQPLAVECGNVPEPTPTPIPVEPTPVPVDPTPTPVPEGPDNGVVEVGSASTCLAENGRIDTNIVNTGAAAATYRIEFQGLTARQTLVGAGDWWRMPITGRADGDYQVVVKRDGVVVSDKTMTVACDTEPPSLATPEVQVVNACRGGNGYILFQFANNSDASKSYIIEFEGVTNRSTSAGAFGGTVRAVTGRQDGSYNVLIRNGLSPLMSLTVDVNCDV